jgi:GGDEF domain-containing protein
VTAWTVGLSSRGDDVDRSARALRAQWRSASTIGGWRFPGDWAVPEVDAVCRAALLDGDLAEALSNLGSARARAGVDLDETLHDLAALHSVLDGPPDSDGLIAADPNVTPPALLRAAAVGWAEVAMATSSGIEATEPLTGLATEAYLRARLGEVYRHAARAGYDVSTALVLFALNLDLADVAGKSRPMGMVLVADVLHSVFDGGETVAALSPSAAVVLAERDSALHHRTARARLQIADRLSADSQLMTVARPEFCVHRLPATLTAAHSLLRHIAQR